jgi:cytochrome P450
MAVLNESWRLFPPVWVLGRDVIHEWEIEGCLLHPGEQVRMSAWLVHRDARYFPEPLRFRPERWLDGSTASIPAYAYFPFGGGQRLCIGRPFALLEATLVLALVARRYRLQATSHAPLVPISSITLRPRHGLPMRVERR